LERASELAPPIPCRGQLGSEPAALQQRHRRVHRLVQPHQRVVDRIGVRSGQIHRYAVVVEQHGPRPGLPQSTLDEATQLGQLGLWQQPVETRAAVQLVQVVAQRGEQLDAVVGLAVGRHLPELGSQTPRLRHCPAGGCEHCHRVTACPGPAVRRAAAGRAPFDPAPSATVGMATPRCAAD
jgi:hypothetical protein